MVATYACVCVYVCVRVGAHIPQHFRVQRTIRCTCTSLPFCLKKGFLCTAAYSELLGLHAPTWSTCSYLVYMLLPGLHTSTSLIGFRGLAYFWIPFSHRNDGLTYEHYCAWIYMSFADLNSGPCTYKADTFLTDCFSSSKVPLWSWLVQLVLREV